jgi:DNA transposition AAA+ family ATPase
MLQITNEFKKQVVQALLEQRGRFDGSDAAFAKQWSINNSVYSRIKNGETEGLLKDTQWLSLGRELGVSNNERKWNMVRTDVFNTIEEDIMFCQQYSKGKICVDDCGIGKTFSAKYLSRTLRNCFYVDASQAKTKQLFIRLIARTIGVDHQGKYADVKANIKYYLKMLQQPLVIIDEAGDLDYPAFLELKELWNATENVCGWYMMGADGLREKIDRGIRSKKVGYRELFSRYSERYTTTVPTDRQEKLKFYQKLITDVLSGNMEDKSQLSDIVRRCLTQDVSGQIGGLRRAESLLILNQAA